MTQLHSHTYYQRTSCALLLLRRISGLKSLLSCMVSRLQTTNKSKRLRFDLEEPHFYSSNLHVFFRLLLGHLNEATIIRSSCLPNFRRTIISSKTWSLLVGSKPRLWSSLIYHRMMSPRKPRLWRIIPNGGRPRFVSPPHSRQAPCRFRHTPSLSLGSSGVGRTRTHHLILR